MRDTGIAPRVLREYAVVADGERGALIGPDGTVVWMCVPRWDSRAAFSGLLDVRSGYGHRRMSGLSAAQGCWTGRSGGTRLRWQGAPRARRDGDGPLRTTITLAPGEHHDLVLELSDRDFGDTPPPDPDMAWQATEEAWSQVVPPCHDLIAVADARHAYAVLRGLTSASGAMVAAATTSLPERMEGGRNYDYRYAWVRDQCYAGIALAAHGPHPLLSGNIQFLTERILSDSPDLMPAYTVAGRPIPDGAPLRLRGFPGGDPQAGNVVRRQFQLDAPGEILSLFAAGARHDMLGERDWRAAAAAADLIEKRWHDPDAGIWELDDRRWAHSRLACAAGLRAIAAAASHGPPGSHGRREASRWTALADRLLASLDDCVHPSGRWQRAPDDERVDAALLIPAIRGAMPADDPRAIATLDAVRDELGSDGYVYRFRHDARPLPEAEGAFLLCGFWMALAEHSRGNTVAAAHWFERNRAACGPPSLYTEEYDVRQRQLRGNLPQAFVHAALLECAVNLSRDVNLGAAG